MVEVLALLAGIALPVSALWMVVRRGKRQLDAATAYRQVARNLGLNVDTRGVSVQGHLGDRRLWVGEVLMGHGPEREVGIWGVVDMTRPLGLGLHVRRRGLSEQVFRRAGGPGIELGDEALDRRLEVRGDEPTRARALIGDRDVKAALHTLMDRWPDVVVTDYAVRVHLRRPESSERALQALVDAMLRLAGALEHARRAVPVPARLESTVEDWRQLSERTGLGLEPWLPALVGELSGRRVLVTIWREDTGYQADLRLYFSEHKQLGLRLRPQVEPDGYWSVGQDIQFDDSEFDAAFVVKGWDPQRVRDTLAPARDALLEGVRVGHLQLDDQRLHLRDLPLDTRSLASAIERVSRIADALGW